MKIDGDGWIVIAFWLLYGPLNLIIWANTDRPYLDLVVIMCLGFAFVGLFFLCRKILQSLSKKKNRKRTGKKEEKEEEAVKEKKDEFSLPSVNLDNIFNEDFKSEAQDLD